MSKITKGKKLAILAGVLGLAIVTVAAFLYREHIRFYWLFEPLGRNKQGYPEYRHRETGIVMVWVTS